MQSDEFLKLAKKYIVKDFYCFNDFDIDESQVLLIWFCKTIQNWKAIFTTNVLDGKIFEVTYNGDKNEIYIDEYVKRDKRLYDNVVENRNLGNNTNKIKFEKYDTLWQY